MKNPFLFACGVPRSGTTLLQRMLDHHPKLAVANDTHFIPRALELTDKSLASLAIAGQPIELTDKLVNNVRQYHRFSRLGISKTEFDEAVARSETYQGFVSLLYDCFAEKSGKPLAGEKTPDYLHRLTLLNGLFPKAKIIHLVRDGRNVALSLMQWAKPDKGPGRIGLWNENPIAVCALWWRWMVLQTQEQVPKIDADRFFQVRYEDLVAMPRAALESICDFLSIEFDERMLSYHRGKSRPQSSLSAKSAWLAPQTGLRDWATDLSEQQFQLFEAIAADALQQFGYEISSEQFSIKTIDQARKYSDWWNEHFLKKRNRLTQDPHDEHACGGRGPFKNEPVVPGTSNRE